MSLADIKTKIETDARKEADEILERARTQAEEILTEADSKIAKTQQEYGERLDNDRPEIMRRRDIVALLDVKKIKLAAKRTLIEDSFKGATRTLESLPAKQYSAFAEALLKSAVTTGKESLLIGKKERVINQSWLDSFNERRGVKLTLSREKADTEAGFVVRNGRVDINCSFAMLVNWIREELEPDVVARLFTS